MTPPTGNGQDPPNSLRELSARFFATVLGADVRTVTVEVIGQDTGVLGALARVNLSYGTGVVGPASVVVKMPTESAENREVGMAFRFYEREGGFYTDVATDCGLSVPHCYFSLTDIDAEAFVLVLEDLGSGPQRRRSESLSPDEAALAVEELAKMHGRWWRDQQLDRLRWLPRVDGPGERDLSLEIYRDGWQPFLGRFGSSLTDEAIVAGGLIRGSFDQVIDHLGTPPLTLVHGDFRADNLFVDVANLQRPLVVLDWQIAYQCRGVFDVAYLLGGSLQIDDRRRVESVLLSRYHEALCRAGVSGYSLDDCIADYRWSLMYATLYPIDAGSFELPTDAMRNMVEQWARRFFTAVVDLDCTALLERSRVRSRRDVSR
jgi:hypothetical protein